MPLRTEPQFEFFPAQAKHLEFSLFTYCTLPHLHQMRDLHHDKKFYFYFITTLMSTLLHHAPS